MRHLLYIVSTLITTTLFPASAHAFEYHCSSTDAMIQLDVSGGNVQDGELHGALLEEHADIRQASVAIRCARQGAESATLLRCVPIEAGRLPLTAYIFRGASRPEGQNIFARVYLNNDVLADLIPCH